MKTRTGISLSYFNEVDTQNAGFHNSIYREKDITSYLNDGSLWTRISSGKFDDLFVGDYFNIQYNGKQTKFLLAGFDVYLTDTGVSNPLRVHHAVIIPDRGLQDDVPMNSDNFAYYGRTSMYNTILPQHVTYLASAIGANHIIPHNLPLRIAASDFSVQSVKSILLSEIEVFGSAINSTNYYDLMSSKCQLPLFRLNPVKTLARYRDETKYSNDPPCEYFLRGIANNYPVIGEQYTCVDHSGSHTTKSYSWTLCSLRPRFIIG